MKDIVQKIQEETIVAIEKAASLIDIQEIRTRVLGRKDSALGNLLKDLKDLSAEVKREMGPLLNTARDIIEEALQTKTAELEEAKEAEGLDLTLPGIAPTRGALHPMTQVMNEMVDIFREFGFMVHEGPELDSEMYNFEALNIKESHPARDMQDTFFIETPITRLEKRDLTDSKWVMRTHTSNMQVRIMEEHEPPIRCIIPGRVFRNEATDATHDHTFYQLEGFVVDKDISVGQLLWMLQEVLRAFYKKDITLRLRPGYFPFVEPGYEVDMSCVFCDQKGCGICKKTGWIEMAGSGMVHPEVFKAAGYPDGKYTGFAFGLGMSRIAMLKYGINDIRLMHENSFEFLNQF
jgi:phenylalanyl-tRNA synthetase alpha chain